MKIIDRETGKRILQPEEKLKSSEVKKELLKREAEKGLEETEHSPMEPPQAYNQPGKLKVSFDDMEKPLKEFVSEHKEVIEQVELFEKALVQFKANGYKVDRKINEVFGNFFKYFDEHILPHNAKEEKTLFPVLNKKLLEAGEHSTGETPVTAIDVMEDDHVKFIQLGALIFNFFGIATRIQDAASRIFILDTAYENARELIELLKLHIYREDYTLFPLAQKYLSKEEFKQLEKEMNIH
ncbi:MAG: hypothetical protein POELPBGB_01177 [Bacteroidia bacterium]|nr:hypothetical protein [Bacteroidia bacterium]